MEQKRTPDSSKPALERLDGEIAPRLTRIEAAYDHLNQQIVALSRTLEAQAHNDEKARKHLDDQITQLASKFEASSKTDWKLFAAFGGLLLAVGGTVGSLAASPFLRDQMRLDREVMQLGREMDTVAQSRFSREDAEFLEAQIIESSRRLEDRLAEHARTIGNLEATRYTVEESKTLEARMLTETRRLEDRMDDSDANLDEVIQREMRLLDELLQREMRMLLDAPNERLKHLESEVERLRGTHGP